MIAHLATLGISAPYLVGNLALERTLGSRAAFPGYVAFTPFGRPAVSRLQATEPYGGEIFAGLAAMRTHAAGSTLTTSRERFGFWSGVPVVAARPGLVVTVWAALLENHAGEVCGRYYLAHMRAGSTCACEDDLVGRDVGGKTVTACCDVCVPWHDALRNHLY